MPDDETIGTFPGFRSCEGKSKPRWSVIKSPSGIPSHSFAITQPPQLGFDGPLQFRGLGELVVQFGDEARHLFLEGIAIVFDLLGADVAAGREHISMRCDFFCRR